MKSDLHNAILSKLQRERQVVTVIITNGYQLKGRITGFDDLVIVVEIRNEQRIVYRHAISTITPDSPIDLDELSGWKEGT